MSKARG